MTVCRCWKRSPGAARLLRLDGRCYAATPKWSSGVPSPDATANVGDDVGDGFSGAEGHAGRAIPRRLCRRTAHGSRRV